MSRRIAALLAVAVGLAGCGGGAHFADKSRPPTPVDLSVYVNDKKVSVSPASVGAGPIIFYVTNSASRTESVTVRPLGGDSASASTGPINPGTTAQVQADLRSGDYTVATSSSGGSDASSVTTKPIASARLHIGPPRPNSNSAVLQP